MKQLYRSGFLFVLILAVAVLFLHSLLYLQPHDWDIDAFLYLGSRLNDGSLLYLNEFETKLPFLQYLFWFPAQMGGIGAWRIIVFCVALLCAFIGSYFLVLSAIKPSDRLRTVYPTAILAFFFLFLLYSLPGSSSAHIELFSASAMYCSLALSIHYSTCLRRFSFVLFVSGILFGAATLVRPNYLYTLPILLLLYYFSTRPIVTFHAIRNVSIFIFGFIAIIVASFLPYCFQDQGVKTLLEALRAIGNFSQGMRLKSLLMEQFHDENTNGLYIFIYAGLVLLPFHILRKRLREESLLRLNRLSLLCLLSCLVINLSFLRNHYFPHNSIMFVPYVTILVFNFCDWRFYAGDKFPFKDLFFKKWIVTAIFFCLIILLVRAPAYRVYVDAQNFLRKPENINLQINSRGDLDSVLMAFLSELKASSVPFLVEGNSNYHRILREPRIGDGHPAILEHILRGNRVMPIEKVFLLSNQVGEVPCLAITQSKKSVVVVDEPTPGASSLIFKCLSQSDSGYVDESLNPTTGFQSQFPTTRLQGRYRVFSKQGQF